MIRKALFCALLSIFVISSAAEDISVAPYDDLLSDIEQKEAALGDARVAGDIDAIIALTKELDSLRQQLATPRMRFLKSYRSLQTALAESENLLALAESNLGPENIEHARPSLDAAKQSLISLESAYGSQNYTLSLDLLGEFHDNALLLPSTIVSEAAEGVDKLRNRLERTSQVTPSMTSMLENAKERFRISSNLYKTFAVQAKTDLESSLKSLEEARSVATQAFGLVSRAKEQKSDIMDPIKLILIFVPLCLIIALLLYFRFQFSRSAIRCDISKNTAPGGRESEIERTITVINIEKEPARMRVFDSPPKALSASEFSIRLAKVAGNDIIWDFRLEPGKRLLITYKLNIPSLDAGWKLRVHGASLSYTVGGKQRKFMGKSAEIKIV